MTYTARRLVADDIDRAIAVITARTEFSGVNDPETLANIRTEHTRRIYNIFDPAVQAYGFTNVFGAFNGDRLDGIMFSSISEHQVSYYLTRAHTIPTTRGSEILGALMGESIRYHEELGYFRFLTVYRESHLKSYSRLWRMHDVAKGYISYTELTLPPFTAPKQVEFWEKLYGRIVIPETTVVRSFIKPTGYIIDRRA